MILALIASLMTALYPWNVESGAFVTTGDWSNGQVYQSQAGYLGFDRWKQDYAVARVHHLVIDEDWYEQYVVSASALRWWKQGLKYGADAGILFGDRDGWFAGPRVEGVLGWIGYELTFQYLDIGLAIPVRRDVLSDYACNGSFLLRHQFGPFLVSAGSYANQAEGLGWSWSPVGRVSGWIAGRLFLSAEHGFGSSVLIVNPSVLTVDLNKDETTAWYELQLTLRLSPHFYMRGEYLRTDLSPDDPMTWEYTASYLTLGLNLRY